MEASAISLRIETVQPATVLAPNTDTEEPNLERIFKLLPNGYCGYCDCTECTRSLTRGHISGTCVIVLCMCGTVYLCVKIMLVVCVCDAVCWLCL